MSSKPIINNKNVDVITLGCRLNIFESEVMRQYALNNNLDNTIIINTCAVTNEAERQSRQAARKAKKNNKNAKIIVTGCSAQLNPDVYKNMPEVDLVLGNHEKMQQESYQFSDETKVKVNDIMSVQETANHLLSSFTDKSRAFLEIQNGCDHRCTFCTIPYARGNNRSSSIAEIVNQVKNLVENGYKEVVLTGVDITGYGANLPAQPTLGMLCKRILSNVPNLPRLRLSSLDPVEVDDDIFSLLANEPRLMPHLHISLQAGDDLILKRMKRRHLRQDVYDFCAKIRNIKPNVVFGADIITGFPTEADEMFLNTIKLVKDCNISYLHVFPYSARKGTPAAKMPQVLKNTRKQRADSLRLLGKQQKLAFYQSLIGQDIPVLMEQGGKGYSEHYAPTHVIDYDKNHQGNIITATVTGCDNKGLIAKHGK